MSNHPVVNAAIAAIDAGDTVFQHSLTIAGGQVPAKRGTVTFNEDPVNEVLNAVASLGWKLVTAQLNRQPSNPEILGMVYLWERS